MTQQRYRLVRSIVVTGTAAELDDMERDVPIGEYIALTGAHVRISNIGVRQILPIVQVPEPPQVPAIPGTTKKGTT